MKRCLTAFVLAVASVFGAAAQMRLSLDAAIELALSENPTIRIAEMEVARYDYVKRQTWGTLLPQVALNGQINHTFIKQNMSKGFSLGGDQYTTISGAVEATMPLFAPAVYRTLKMNDTQMAAAVEVARASRVDLVAEVRKAFYNILLAEQSLAVLLESQATVQRTVDDTELQYRNGLMSEYDLLTAQVQLSNLKPTIIQTENSIAVAKRLLKMYLSIPETVDIEVEGHLSFYPLFHGDGRVMHCLGRTCCTVVDGLGEARYRVGRVGGLEGGQVDGVEEEFIYVGIVVLGKVLVEDFFYSRLHGLVVLAYFAGVDGLVVFVF